jgi:hypothetical protein
MPRTEHLVLCGGTHGQRHADTKSLRLNLHGPSENVHLKISDLSERLVANIPNVLIDLLEVASYIYAADSAIHAAAQLMSDWASDGDENFGS